MHHRCWWNDCYMKEMTRCKYRGMKVLMSVVCGRFHRRICLKEVSGWRRKRTALRTRSCLPNSLWPSPPRPRVSRSASHFTHTTSTPSHIKPVSLSPLSYSTQPLKVRDSPRSVLAHLCVCVSTETLIPRHWLGQTWKTEYRDVKEMSVISV